ncbi:MAG: TrkH family potassium uptake protein [Gammaproteobacteria bacterium]
MHLSGIQRIVGLLLMVFSLTLVPPVGVSLFCHDDTASPFLIAFVIILSLGFFCWYPVRRASQDLRTRDGFLVVVLFWLVLGLVGAVPFILAHHPHMSLTDATFESISGLTTTGATVISGLDSLPASILYYRQQLQWLGGMGIVVLAVAILPMLGIGGMQIYRAEMPGPDKDARLTPRITQTAKALWLIYLGYTVACAAGYWLAGMSLFDAVGHSFATISTGGFSTHDASFGYFQSPVINAVAVLFMVMAGLNFTVHYQVFALRSIGVYSRNEEVRAYLYLLAGNVVLISSYLFVAYHAESWFETVQHVIFQVVSFSTSTGFTSTDYQQWPVLVPVQLIFISFIGGCASSTAGGMKVVRVLLLFKQGMREIARLVHSHVEIPIKLEHKSVSGRVIDAVWGFFAVYIISFGVLMMLMMGVGVDQVTAFSAVSTTLNNLGPGLGEVTTSFISLPDSAKWISCLSMLLGRLEVFTLLVLFTPVFWRD